jgi:hypothetical protein
MDVICIFELTEEQIKAAVELYKIKQTDEVTAEQSKKAYDLHMALKQYRPSFEKGPDSVKPRDEDTLSPFFFKDPKRIIYLTRWSLNILPFIQVFKNTGSLPLNRANIDIQSFVADALNEYLNDIRRIFTSIPEESNILKPKDVHRLDRITRGIQNVLSRYLEGYPSLAYEKIEEVMDSEAFDYYKQNMTIKDNGFHFLYKMRIGTADHIFTKEEMLHIPFELRGLVSSNRYSIPGLPCVYLGSSSLACWEELNKPDLNTIQTSLFVPNGISYLNISTPPGAQVDRLLGIFYKLEEPEELNEKLKELVSYIVLWPLVASCSIRVSNPKDSFKPEYIIPQLLLQWVRDSSNFDGICYFSTKVENYGESNAELYKNFAFPAQKHEGKGYCSKLKEKFSITDAVPWQTFQIYKDTEHVTTNGRVTHPTVELLNGLKLNYSNTDFSKLESLLISILGSNPK